MQNQGGMVQVHSKLLKAKTKGARRSPRREAADKFKELAYEFAQNPNLCNVIKKLEERQKRGGAYLTDIPDEEATLIEETRTKKYRKPLDLLGARQDRIKMVLGLKRSLEKE